MYFELNRPGFRLDFDSAGDFGLGSDCADSADFDCYSDGFYSLNAQKVLVLELLLLQLRSLLFSVLQRVNRFLPVLFFTK